MNGTLFRYLVAALVCIVLTACAAPIYKASESFTREAQAFAPPADRAAIYVIRPTQFVAMGASLTLLLDHKEFGTLPPKSYLYTTVLPRSHVLDVQLALANNVSLRFTAEAGKCYFFYAASRIGGLEISPLDEAEGKRMVAASQLSGDNVYEVEPGMPATPR